MLSTHPFLVVYVVWHPDFEEGAAIARELYDHYRRQLYQNIAGGTGLSVIYRSVPLSETSAPIPIDFSDGETAAVVALLDDKFIEDKVYVNWLNQQLEETEKIGLSGRVFPVAIDEAAVKIGLRQQVVRWDQWANNRSYHERLVRLKIDLTHQFCRMLRVYLEQLKHPTEKENALEQYLRKVQVFLSHSKHDADGEKIAKKIRQKLFDDEGLASFFDVKDIPTGMPFDTALLHYVRTSAVVGIHTDSYSSREWCRREIIEAKKWHVPFVVVNAISDIDERGFPYLGNVPVVRMSVEEVDARCEHVILRLLDEVLKDFLWRCRVKLVFASCSADVTFFPRPPELISLASLESDGLSAGTIVYPDPPLGAEEQRLFEILVPKLRLRSLTEWLAEMPVEA
jgi:hypothetical protein